MARVFCMKCKTWVQKADFAQPNEEALSTHETSCAATLAETLFGQHPDLIDLAEMDIESLEQFYGEA